VVLTVLLLTIAGFIACIAWGRYCWYRGFASAKEIASHDVLYWRAECVRVQTILHEVPSIIVSEVMKKGGVPKP